VHALQTSSAYEAILQEFPSLQVPNFASAGKKYDVEHFINTTGPPLRARARRLDPERLAASKETFKDMEEQRISFFNHILRYGITSVFPVV